MRTFSFTQYAAPTARTWRCFLTGAFALLCAGPAQAQLAAPNDVGVTFSHVHLSVSDADLHKKLWVELFDGEVVEKAGFTAVRVPGALVFLTPTAPTAPSAATAMDHFGVKVRDLDAVLTAWQALGYEVEQKPSEATGVSRVYLTLPDGIRLALEEDSGLSVKAEMSHVHFFAPQHRALMAWYADLFGARPQARGDSEAAAHIPGAELRFSNTEAGRAPTDDTAIDHIGFEVEKMEAFVERLRGKGVEFVFGPRYIESLELWVAFFLDPSGVLVEVSEGLDTY